MAQQFIADELIEAAQQATGLQRFDSESFREGLDVLLADANKVDYPEMGIARWRSSLIGALSTRLKTTAYLQQRPELLKRDIERPVFSEAGEPDLSRTGYLRPGGCAGCRRTAAIRGGRADRRLPASRFRETRAPGTEEMGGCDPEDRPVWKPHH